MNRGARQLLCPVHFWGWVAFCTLLGFSQLAEAMTLRTEVAARKVGVGQAFEVRLTAVQSDDDPPPTQPKLQLKGQADLSGPSISTQRSMKMMNFSFTSEKSVVATWRVIPRKIGKLTVGPGSFQVGGKTIRGEQVVVEVVEAEQQVARSRSPFGRRGSITPGAGAQDPFDFFGRRRRGINSLPEAPTKYQVSKAPDEVAFIRATLDKRKAVLGEPIRLTILAYGSKGNFREVSPTEPALADFLSYSVVESSHDEPAYQTTIEDKLYLVRKLREYIIIPLDTGKLKIGGMHAVLQGNAGSYPLQGSPHGMKISGPDLTIDVVTAPLKGRPPGFFPGDVGRYKIKAHVSPRTLQKSEFAEVIVQIYGEGQLPSKVLLPESKDVIWEPPVLKGGPEVKDGKLKGSRTLKFALQVNKTGHLALGEVTLPFYNPRTRRYATARADLGEIEVEELRPTGGATDAPKLPTGQSPPIEVATTTSRPLAARSSLLPWSPPRAITIPLWAWLVVVVTPVIVISGLSVRDATSSFRKGRVIVTPNEARSLLRLARSAFNNGDQKEGLRFVERALYEAIDHASGIKTKGLLRTEVAATLTKAGIDEKLSLQAQKLLEGLESLVYGEGSLSAQDLESATISLVAQCAKLEKIRLKKRSSPSKTDERNYS